LRRVALGLILVGVLNVVACSGDSDGSSSTSPTSGTGDVADARTRLDAAVREALTENNRLAGYVLWRNVVPTWARRSTRGRALAEMRRATAEARRRGIRVRTISSDLDISDIELDPSYAGATANIRQTGRIRVYRDGRPLGGSSPLSERARVELRRLGRAPRFVVSEVRVLP
jgi:hypothetical protein